MSLKTMPGWVWGGPSQGWGGWSHQGTLCRPPPLPCRPMMLLMTTMWPPRRRFMSGSTSLTRRTRPKKLVSMRLCMAARLWHSRGPTMPTPALLTAGTGHQWGVPCAGGVPRPVHRGSPAWDTLGEEGPRYTGCPRHGGSLVQDVPGTEGPWCTSCPWHRGSPAPGAQRVPSVGCAWCGQSPVHGVVPSTRGCPQHGGSPVLGSPAQGTAGTRWEQRGPGAHPGYRCGARGCRRGRRGWSPRRRHPAA